jgi:hypothetical protein
MKVLLAFFCLVCFSKLFACPILPLVRLRKFNWRGRRFFALGIAGSHTTCQLSRGELQEGVELALSRIWERRAWVPEGEGRDDCLLFCGLEA